MKRRAFLGAVGAGLCALAVHSPAAFAADAAWPDKPIRLIVPYPPGGVTDLAGRLVGEIITKKFGQPVVVENRPGANGLIGSQAVARAPADGYTLLLNGLGGIVLPPATLKGYPIDYTTALTPIAQMAEFVNVLVVGANSDIRSVDDLLARARANGDKGLSYGSNGTGASAHMTTEFFCMRTDIKCLHAAYKGSGELLIDVANGNLDFSFSNLPPVVPLIKKGVVRPIAVTSPYRSRELPDVPTLQELGLQDFAVTSWLGVYGPAGMNPEIVQRLSQAIVQGVSEAGPMNTLASAGFEPKPASMADFAKLNRAELERWSKVARDAGVSLNFGS
ncbi:tripartite tricarboxylate transporter substrate binding protein [Bordetella sp. 15P40C-2]|uniref:Bug family tripartite tricarboxylate transporter substrate binding protein n=1 Tax=Bordetella sp. 15P40C-2 TaxID=2572246 RepID=UPI00132547AD|nr:tripartite tricarboxylate transporter substrate binding protein [Bordetella sp. 15P40C-2]MVW69916.1 tripartite tricarboxylate transporter substrate binding protein [Bordetella sp. 15P40C-2]